MVSQENQRTRIFISYSHKDKKWLEYLQVHLSPLKLNIWDDTQLLPGSYWEEEIKKAVKAAKVAILLVSPEFLASNFITTNELPPLLRAAEEEGAIIIPVIISHSLYEQTPELAQFKPANNPSKPLRDLTPSKRDKVLRDLAVRVKSLISTVPASDLQASATRPTESADTRRMDMKQSQSPSLESGPVNIPGEVIADSTRRKPEYERSHPKVKLAPKSLAVIVVLFIVAAIAVVWIARSRDVAPSLLELPNQDEVRVLNGESGHHGELTIKLISTQRDSSSGKYLVRAFVSTPENKEMELQYEPADGENIYIYKTPGGNYAIRIAKADDTSATFKVVSQNS